MRDRNEYERARTPEAKQERVATILLAARTLALSRGIRAVTLTDIAAEVGMHKSTMLRYFETREEIFLRLAASEWEEWAVEMVRKFSALHVPSTTNPEDMPGRASAAAHLLASSLVARPLFCDLLAQTPLNLERGVSFETVREFKLVAIASSGTVKTALEEWFPLKWSDASNVVGTAVGLAGAFWQMAAPGTQLQEFYLSDALLFHVAFDVESRLHDVLTALIVGYASGSTFEGWSSHTNPEPE
jgi:AcrR family transcriptional regulator